MKRDYPIILIVYNVQKDSTVLTNHIYMNNLILKNPILRKKLREKISVKLQCLDTPVQVTDKSSLYVLSSRTSLKSLIIYNRVTLLHQLSLFFQIRPRA